MAHYPTENEFPVSTAIPSLNSYNNNSVPVATKSEKANFKPSANRLQSASVEEQQDNQNIDSDTKPEMTSKHQETNTPSMPKCETFASPNIILMPETPKRISRQIHDIDNNLEGTPLLSPPPSSTSHFLSTPHRRKGSNNTNTDFYTLLKSPEVRSDDKKLKRRSMEVYGIVNSPDQMHKEYDNEHLLKSPRRNTKEIRMISENLRTRLNYANLKVQHGWSNKSIGELENSLEEIASNPQRSSQLNSKHLDDFWNLRADNLPSAERNSDNYIASQYPNNNAIVDNKATLLPSPGKFTSSRQRRRSSVNSGIRLDEIAKRGLKHLSPEMKSSASMSNSNSLNGNMLKLQSSPLKKEYHSNLSINTDNPQSSDKLEHDAVISLMTLSSPKKYAQSMSPSPPRYMTSPTKTSFGMGLPSLDGLSDKRLPPLQAPLSAPELIGNQKVRRDSFDKFSRNNSAQFILPTPPNFEVTSQSMGSIPKNGIQLKPLVGISSSINSTNSITKQNGIDNDATDDETTEEEVSDDENDRVYSNLITNSKQQRQQENNNNKYPQDKMGIFRNTKFDGNKMTSHKE